MARFGGAVAGLLLLATCASPPSPSPHGLGPPLPVSQDARSLAAAEMRFAVDLHRELAAAKGNLFVSPHSIAEAVSMAAVGARGDTETALRATLRLDLDTSRLPEAYRNLDATLTRTASASHESRLVPTVSIGNALWADGRYGLKSAYVSLLRDGFSADARNADFASGAAGIAREVNAWVARITEGRVREMLHEDTVHPDMGLLLLNAVFFRAPWEHAFEVEDTRPRDFTQPDGNRVRVPMMRQVTGLRYREGDGWQLAELPYTGVEASCVILLPRPGRLAEVEGALDAAALEAWIAEAQETLVSIDLPRIKIASAADLGTALRRLGMEPAFATDADFTGATDFRPCFVDAVLHQAALEVDEEGTVAAAATALAASCSPVDTPPPVPFVVDRPFLLLLRNTTTGAPLFFGRITDPGTRAP